MSNRWNRPIGDYRLDPPARVICPSESHTLYTLDCGNRDFRVRLCWYRPDEEASQLMGVECIGEVNANGDRIKPEPNERVKKAVEGIFNRRWESKEFQRRIRAFAQRWHDEGY